MSEPLVVHPGSVATSLHVMPPMKVTLSLCSSTPMTVTPSRRVGSSIRTRRPSVRTASLAVSHATANPSAILATVRCCMTSARKAHASPPREIFARGSAAVVVSCRHTCPHPVHRYRRTVTSKVVGRHPKGSCANSRVTVSRGTLGSRTAGTSHPAPRPGTPAPPDPSPCAVRSLPTQGPQGGRTSSDQAW